MYEPKIWEFSTLSLAAKFFVHHAAKHPHWFFAIYFNHILATYYIINARHYNLVRSDHPIRAARLLAAADLSMLREFSTYLPPDMFTPQGKAIPLPEPDADASTDNGHSEECNDCNP